MSFLYNDRMADCLGKQSVGYENRNIFSGVKMIGVLSNFTKNQEYVCDRAESFFYNCKQINIKPRDLNEQKITKYLK